LAETGAWVGRVRATVSPGAPAHIALEPATNGHGSKPAAGSTTGTTPSAVATAIVAPQAPKLGPAIAVTSPDPGSFTTVPYATVAGTVTDPSGVQAVLVQGLAIPIAAGGSFSTVVPLHQGLNTIVVESWNAAGDRSKHTLSIIEGTFTPEGTPIAGSVVARLDGPALD